LVEHDLAKVGVASSNLVSRSIEKQTPPKKRGLLFKVVDVSTQRICPCGYADEFKIVCPGGGIGRHAGLKILWAVMPVRVQLPSRVLK
jgi:hypothetical protein